MTCLILGFNIDYFLNESHKSKGKRACFEKRSKILFEDVESHNCGRQGVRPLSSKPRSEGVPGGVSRGGGEEGEESLGHEAQEEEESVDEELTLNSLREIL